MFLVVIFKTQIIKFCDPGNLKQKPHLKQELLVEEFTLSKTQDGDQYKGECSLFY